MTNNSLKSKAFKLKGRLYTFTVFQILDIRPQLISSELADVIAKAPKLFENTPVVLDFTLIKDQDIDLQHFCQIIRTHGIIPVAIQGGNAFLDTMAQCQGLAVLNASSHLDKALDITPSSDNSSNAQSIKSKLFNAQVRSGQQVVSKNTDLIVTSSVSHGAELLADGNIHVYGTLRGRALAGISGDTEARIFCQSLEAELVSIAGYYRLSDAIEKQNRPCQIYLKDEHIQIEPL